MSDGGVSIDLSGVLPYAEEKIRVLLGKDQATVARNLWLKQLHETAIEITQSVQCIGMHKPVPFEKIYQPTKLRVISGLTISRTAAFGEQNRMAQSIALAHSGSANAVSVSSFLESPENAIVFAGPGWGKTTFLHAIFRREANRKSLYTVLITLRRPREPLRRPLIL
jgi:hypothetical protein